ncbi:zinc finger and BTB domain-containing protein 40 [Discoglossus pictus]
MELPNYSRQILQQLHTLCKEQHFCDCTIFIGTLQFRAHKLVLAAASLLFKSLLETTEAISIDASVVTPEEFSLLLEMMYSGKLPPGKHNLTKIISVADSLQMFDVAVSCKNLLTELMSHSTLSQKVKDVSVHPLPQNKTEIIAKNDFGNSRNDVSNEMPATEKLVSPVSTGGSLVVSSNDESEINKSPEVPSIARKLEMSEGLQSTNSTNGILHEDPTEQFHPLEHTEVAMVTTDESVVAPPSLEKVDNFAKLDAEANTEASERVVCPLEMGAVSDVHTIQENNTQTEVQEVEEKLTEAGGVSEDACVVPTPCDSSHVEMYYEEEDEPAEKKRRLNEQETERIETERISGELDFLIRYENIFSEALSDPQSVLQNLEKCREIKDTEKLAVIECCKSEEGSSTFTKLLEKVKEGQIIVVDTVLALLKLCRHTNPNVNKALLEKEPQKEAAFQETRKKEKHLFDLLLEHKEELIHSITELSPIIECLDTAEEGFLTSLEKQVIVDCCEGGSHKEAMDKLVRKATETKMLSPDSFIKLLQAVREAFPDLHALLEMLETHSKISYSPDKMHTIDFGMELLRQYHENISEAVASSEDVLRSLSSASNLTAHESEVMGQIVKQNSCSKILSTLMSSVLEDESLTAMAVWQLLFAIQESTESLKSLMEEIRKEPEAEQFFQQVINRENEAVEIVLCYSELIAQAIRQCDILKAIPPENETLTALVKELLNIPQTKEDSESPSKQVLSAALKQSVPIMQFCDLLCSIEDSAPDLQPVMKEFEQLGLLPEGKNNLQVVNKWNVNNECQVVVLEDDEEKNQEDDETKDNENEEMDSTKETTTIKQEKGSIKKNYICKSCDKIFLFRCRLEVHMKRCRMAKRNPLECKDCNEVQASKKELDQHREDVHGYLISRTNKGKRRILVTCDICGKQFAHPSGLQYHKRTEHFDEKPFSCNECGAKFAANSTLKNHQRLHTGERPFVCKHCHMTFTQAAALSYHTKKKHSEGKMYVCQYCDAVFAQSIELTRHVRTHTGDKPYVCRECGKGFSQANGLSIHLRTFHNIEDPYDCQKCRMSFPTLEENRQHIQVVHSKEYHPCPTCEKIFSAPSLLERHVVTHVGGKPYNCEICDKAYQQLSGLWYHNRTHHPDLFAAQNHRSPKFTLQCTSCEQSFSNTSTLQKHAKLEHADEKVYECDKCKQTYPTPAALQVHVKCKHSGAQPFQCLYCSDSFQFPGALQHHVATEHFNETENTFGCELCGELFTAQAQLERHYETDHPEVVLAEAQATDAQMVQVIQTQDQVTSAEQVITLDESQLSSSQVIVALPDSQSNQNATELVAVSMEDLLDGTVTLICGDPVTGVTQRTQS